MNVRLVVQVLVAGIVVVVPKTAVIGLAVLCVGIGVLRDVCS